MVWTGDADNRLAPAILTLFQQLQQASPGGEWQRSDQTGTIGNEEHKKLGSASDHNPWLNHTVRALDVATNVSGVPHVDDVSDSPDCEAIFAMVNRMYAAKDPRVFPNGYTIFNRRITDPSNPGGFKDFHGDDTHELHVHISASQNPDGYNSTDPWPIGEDMPLTENEWTRLQTMIDGAVQRVHNDLTGTMLRIREYETEIVGLRDYIRGTACALAGQLPALPDGTRVTSISVAHAEELSAIAQVHAQIAASIEHNVRGGDPLIGGPGDS
jgi:hypothetical protein